jgi:hypothetical protein
LISFISLDEKTLCKELSENTLSAVDGFGAGLLIGMN